MLKHALFVIVGIITAGLFFPADSVIPVENAKCYDWNPKTFWYEPWGTSGVHKGIDIFAKENTPLLAATDGVVVFATEFAKSGLVIGIVGPKWRLHYYAHLNGMVVKPGDWVDQGEVIGLVGKTGNAAGKPAHVHYSVMTPLPYPWRITTETQGWKKMFYLNPADAFTECG
ncbi:M23 family metallopeptidase [Thaumasiovibrio subtropicus]|uniref:M23 family metallopeptidase n=1 Tax=Thaumasiovibrio subtropicus TaxID=1891207 RepID=UPI000B35F3C2|nr:M23 family metallopeptidase [Thaumasiovibrio subtropicus]